MKAKSVLITDLDNTLFDWVEIWHKTFATLFDHVVKQTGLDPAEIKDSIRPVHQKHGTSEYSFVLQEVDLLAPFIGENEAHVVFADAINASQEARRSALILYPTVMETLQGLKKAGCVVVGYTESMAFYTSYRVRKMGLDGVIDVLYSPEDHDIPTNLDLDQIRKYPAGHYNFEKTRHEHTPKGELKPNPHILKMIIDGIGAAPDDCVYVGDSLYKDIAMAKDAGVDHAWAKYGTAQHRDEYKLLREVTHWTNEDVEREKRIKQRDVEPDHVLKNQFDEILKVFEFRGK